MSQRTSECQPSPTAYKINQNNKNRLYRIHILIQFTDNTFNNNNVSSVQIFAGVIRLEPIFHAGKLHTQKSEVVRLYASHAMRDAREAQK